MKTTAAVQSFYRPSPVAARLRAALARLRDPQAWVSLIGLLTLSGLLGGAFDSGEAEGLRAQSSGPVEVVRLAAAELPSI
ncbi:hypothetical protein [Pelomonas sp. SE-A7]|uniref:hypothetical protein n=1 Tax=Pelomonas sp. SE-A7 TaxID=3054953 RepID=UPI00259CB56D|nr:hypothetical protein [Pelomonas sp. SE-A7]MDM4765282.1 hypothetical protein [Pelomonas sp. SE-A7]